MTWRRCNHLGQPGWRIIAADGGFGGPQQVAGDDVRTRDGGASP
jgi:hypothetical protein